MTDRTTMVVHVEMAGRGRVSRDRVTVPIGFDLGHLPAWGWILPRLRGQESSFGDVMVDRDFVAGELSPPLTG